MRVLAIRGLWTMIGRGIEHDAFRALLAEGGAEVVVAGPDEAGLLDAIFTYDPSLMTDAGAVLLRPGKELRLPEVDLAEQTYAELGNFRSSGASRRRGPSRAAIPSGSTSERWRWNAAIARTTRGFGS